MFQSPIATASVFAVCGFAIIVGAWRERMGGVIYLIGYVLNGLLGLIFPALFLVRYLIADSIAWSAFFICAGKALGPGLSGRLRSSFSWS